MTSNSPELGRDELPGGIEGPSVDAVAGEALIDLVPAGREGLFEAVPGASPEYDFRVEGTADWQWRDAELTGVLDDQVVALHDGSLAYTMPPGADALGRLFERAGDTATVSYDRTWRHDGGGRFGARAPARATDRRYRGCRGLLHEHAPGLHPRGLLGVDRCAHLGAVDTDTLSAVLEAVLASAIICTRHGVDPPTVQHLLTGRP
jgi:hypothetical protein